MRTIKGAVAAGGSPEVDVDTWSWRLPCTDAFGRSYELVITAQRGGPASGIGISSPAGEYGLVEVNRVGDLAWVINRATVFILNGRDGGDRPCTPRL